MDIEKKKKKMQEYAESKREVERLEMELEALGEEKAEWTEEEKRMQQSIKEEISRKRVENIKRFDTLQKAIGEIPNQTEREILTYRYIKGMKWGEISVITKYEHTQTMRIHRRALYNIKI